ncbi:hypothetical protein FIBSPDRAFT_83421 [Athelia psychrophila]|uniref:Uncharacterized protein n=1 Tax=Athelia psychrophila TaxID=1759441 RepID=A0A167U333_9AGAM|nr:hypothetical protein FIBSPDRAFT_941462 [Fibularhizoctonia sp. CBS 109695]KZP15351.1 hypothetical protein FIBSPDRAFT_83421 [Fibularhizoctonia sp. CBS 109695]
MTPLDSHQVSQYSILTQKLESQASERAGLSWYQIPRHIELEEERAETQRELNSLINLQSPVYSLPEELLSEILQIGQKIHVVEDDALGPAVELSASQVTRHWRDVATRTPRLWTKIHLPKGSIQIEQYLQRSQGLALDVIISDRTTSVRSLCILLNQSSPTLHQPLYPSSRLSNSHSISHISRLRSLSVDGYGVAGTVLQEIIRCVNSGDTSCLTWLKLSAHFPPSSNRPPVTVSTALKGMSSLVHLELDLRTASRDQELSTVLPVLLTLHLDVVFSRDMSKFLALLDAPILDCLAISASWPTALDESCIKLCPSRLPSLRHLIFQENGSFTSLSLYSTSYTSYAAAFPNVTHLELAMAVQPFIQTILEGVSPVTHKPFWPALQILAVQRNFLEVPVMISALSRRRDNGHPIQQLLTNHVQDIEAFGEVVELLPYINTWQYMPPE